MGIMGRIGAPFATFPHILPLSLKAPWPGGGDLTDSQGLVWTGASPPCFLPPLHLSLRVLCPHLGPYPLWSVPLCPLPPHTPCRGPAAALLCHLLSHAAAHPLHVHQPLPGHLHHLHHLPQCGHHVPGALQSAHGEPGLASGPRSHGGVGSSARPHPRDGVGRGLNRPHAQEAQGLVGQMSERERSLGPGERGGAGVRVEGMTFGPSLEHG